MSAKAIFASLSLLIIATISAQAKANIGRVHEFCQDRYCAGRSISSPIEIKRRHSRVKYAGRHRHGVKPRIARRGGGRDGCRSGVGALSCVVGPLAAKAHEIVDACGSTVVSAVAGRPNRSNHPIGRAVDLVGNPSCIYSHLHGWAGGYSTDYGRVHHVHVSYNPGGQEWGVRFAHGGHRHHTRYARRGGVPRYATALPPSIW